MRTMRGAERRSKVIWWKTSRGLAFGWGILACPREPELRLGPEL
jgi:hypothetical protein